MERRWKWFASVVGLALMLFTGYVAWKDFQRAQPRLVVYLTGVELLAKPINRTEVAAALERIERDHHASTGFYLIELMDDLQRSTGNTTDENADETPTRLADRITAVQDQIESATLERQNSLGLLADKLARVAIGDPPFVPLVNELHALEDQYAESSEQFVLRLIQDAESDERDAAGMATARSDAVAEIRSQVESLKEARRGVANDLKALTESLVDDTKRLHVRITLENHSQFPTVVRSNGAIAVLGERIGWTDVKDVYGVFEQTIEPFALKELELRSLLLPKEGVQEIPRLETAKCVVSVRDIHGTDWRSELSDCVDPSEGRDRRSAAERLEDVVSKKFGPRG